MAEFNAAGSGESPRASDDSDSLRSALESAMAGAETVDAPEKPVATDATVKEPPTETDAEKKERLRDEAGRFKAADEKAAKEKVEGEPEKPVVEPKPEGEQPAAGPEAPAHWSKRDKELFANTTPEMQAWMLDRHKSMEADYSKKTGAIADLKKEYEPVDQLFAPYKDQMRAMGLSPSKLIEGWANVEKRLMGGDGVGVIKGLIEGYKIDPAAVAQALGIAQPQQRQQAVEQQQPQLYYDAQGNPVQIQPPAPPQLPPELIREIQTLRQRQDDYDRNSQLAAQAANERRAQQVVTAIDDFRSETDGKGNLLHPHFEEVEAQMTHLANSARASGQAPPPLKELYETAVWANTSTRAKELAARETAQRDKAATEARAKAAAARKAGSSVTGAPGTGQAQTSKSEGLSLREQLEESFAENAA